MSLRYLGALALLAVAGCQRAVRPEPPPDQLADLTHAADLRQHTFSVTGSDLDPEVSPDGAHLYFASDHDTPNHHLYAKRLHGRTLVRLTSGEADHRQPRVSPDGRWLAYATNAAGNWDVWVLDLKDPRAKPAKAAATPDDELGPSWSPKGERLLYSRWSSVAGGWEIWSADLGSGQAERIGETIEGLLPRQSPDGAWVLFQRFRAREPQWSALWYMRTDGTEPTQLLSHPEWGAITPSWDPSGEWVVFATVGKAQALRAVLAGKADDVWIVKKDGTRLARLTGDSASDWSPVWARIEGEERIFFVSDRASDRANIWSVRARRE